MDLKLSKYIIPSIISMVLIGTYTNIDGFFIGNTAGDDGLAAINIVWPIVALITSIGTGIGVGGSVMLGSFRGRDDNKSAEQIKTTMLLMLLVVGVISGLLLWIVSRPLLELMGASGRVLAYSVDYSDIICLGSVFQIMGSGLVVLLRNEQKTYFSMFCCIAGLIVHLLLDILLVENYALGGVAVSTVASQAVVMIMSLFALRFDIKAKIKKNNIISILKASTSPLGINFVPSVVLLFTNYFALLSGGTAGVSAYAVMSYAVYTFDYIYQGVCDGIQPIISYCWGAGNQTDKKRAVRAAVIILAAFTILFILITPGLIFIMPELFAVSDAAAKMMNTGFVIYAVSYPFKAIVKFICSYYYSCGKTKLSNVLIYIDPVIFTPMLLAVLSKLFGINGVWLSMTLAQALVAALGLSLLYKKHSNK
ncbi:MAG: polysaccharide biosynthesis C-terminal domain-containing protein [Clostridia bacterium]|nr:polysaccharide biosynthesis C-terminal domain-containing protein [Clostridia bacterium]